MNTTMRITSLSIIALLILCALGSAAAAPIKMTAAAHKDYITSIATQQETTLALMLNNNTTKINEPVYLGGVLWSGTQSAPNYIENARVTIQRLSTNGTWIPIGTATTEKGGEYKGTFTTSLTPRGAGVFIFRATYDGDDRFAPSVSNVVMLTVYQ